jgi:hypothetical protein
LRSTIRRTGRFDTPSMPPAAPPSLPGHRAADTQRRFPEHFRNGHWSTWPSINKDCCVAETAREVDR